MKTPQIPTCCFHLLAAVQPYQPRQLGQERGLRSKNKMKFLTMRLLYSLKSQLNLHHPNSPRLSQPPNRQEEGEEADVLEADVAVVVDAAAAELHPVLITQPTWSCPSKPDRRL